MKHFHILFLLLTYATTTHSTILVRGNEKNAPFSFTTPISAQAFDYTTGSCIVCLNGQDTGNYAIARANRPHKGESPVFIPITPEQLINQPIKSLILTPHNTHNPTIAIIVPQHAIQNSSNTFTALSLDGKQSTTSNPLTDAQGNITNGIISTAASATHVFSAIKPSKNNKSDCNLCIAVTKINRSSQGILQLDSNTTCISPYPQTFDYNVALHYDTQLNTLYCGIHTSTHDQVKTPRPSLLKATYDTTTEQLTFTEIPINIADIHHLHTMHTSTKQNYLIINGGNNMLHELWSLPIAHNAHKNNMTRVGDSNLPTAPTTPISHLEVIGDTVYVSIAHQQDKHNDAGIFYSQALFNADGDIIRWTPWTKRAAPNNNGVSFFSLDPLTGSMWITENKPHTATYMTHWYQHADFSRVLHNGCYSALDLDQATRGFLHNTADRYALFGGINTVLITRVSHAHNNDSIASPQTIITDISKTENFLLTQLPIDAGQVHRLEYSKRDLSEKNFFFAGTQKGLFTFAHPHGDGFFSHELSTLNTAPFTTSSWKHIPTISNPIIDLTCAGNALYALTSQPTATNLFKTILYVIPFAPLEHEKPTAKNTISLLFAPDNIHIIAESGIGVFSDITSFSAIGIVATSAEYADNGDSAEKREQLVLATSNGLFATHASQEAKDEYVLAGIADARNQTEAQWKLISRKNQPFSCIGSLDTPIAHTLLPISYSNTKKETFSAIHQILGSENPHTGPNTALISDTKNELFLLPGRTNYVWSDGARSFYITTVIEQGIRKNKLMTSEFNSIENEITEQIRTFFWIKNIGATGLIMAGTDQGIVVLG